MSTSSRIRSLTNGLGLEIEKLIRQLPGADPHLKGDMQPIGAFGPTAEPASGPARRPSVQAYATVSPNASAPPIRKSRQLELDRRWELAGVWSRTIAAVALGAAVVAWPYANACGLQLYLYLGVVGSVLISSSWASMTAWRSRIAPAHVLGLVVFFWGIVLAAEQVLPRIGYAAIDARWACGG